MGRILAVDYGNKRIGLAVTDPLKIIATGLTTVHSKDIWDFLSSYFMREKVDAVVVGFPKHLDNTATDATPHVVGFVNKLKKLYPSLEVHTLDERYTSKMAVQSMVESGMKKKNRQNKELIDEISATIILQNYMSLISKK
ncbi:MAG TPA: Holliday junction resolvase RuvX [Bacteroidales bacterium]|nr:MAG: Holliday junction DNA helicase RuvA [Bacteroidetes bacterium GWF2_33_38]OFY76446.1 MAG: Holliday junction DNA helicase RuvA [Bacteroidetes bacterium RIFOXYA12_FULL_33_9]HBF88866.1 Holliday junction resolvase RuvX [Bacteroidales bacterium]